VDKPEMDLTLKERAEMAREFLKIFGGIFEVSEVSYKTQGRGEKTVFDLMDWNADAVQGEGSLTFAYLVGSDHRHFWSPKVITKHLGDADGGEAFFNKEVAAYDFNNELDTLGKFAQQIDAQQEKLGARNHKIEVFFNDRPGFTSDYENAERNWVARAGEMYHFDSFEGQKFEASSTDIRKWMSGEANQIADVILPTTIRTFLRSEGYASYRAVAELTILIKANPELKKVPLAKLVEAKLALDGQGIVITPQSLLDEAAKAAKRAAAAEAWRDSVWNNIVNNVTGEMTGDKETLRQEVLANLKHAVDGIARKMATGEIDPSRVDLTLTKREEGKERVGLDEERRG